MKSAEGWYFNFDICVTLLLSKEDHTTEAGIAPLCMPTDDVNDTAAPHGQSAPCLEKQASP